MYICMCVYMYVCTYHIYLYKSRVAIYSLAQINTGFSTLKSYVYIERAHINTKSKIACRRQIPGLLYG